MAYDVGIPFSSIQRWKDIRKIMKKVITYLFYLFCILMFSCMKVEKPEALQKEDIEKLLKRFYSNRFTIKSTENNDNKISISIIDTLIVVTVNERDTLFNNKYHEFHQYIAEDDSTEFTVKYFHNSKIQKHPKTGRNMNISERANVNLRIPINNFGTLKRAGYIEYVGYLSDLNGNFVTKFSVNDSVFAYSRGDIIGPLIFNKKKIPSRKLIVPISLENRCLNINEIELHGLCVYTYIYYLLLEFIYLKYNIDVIDENGLITFSVDKISQDIKDKCTVIVKYNDFVTKKIVEEMVNIGKDLGIEKIEKINI